MARPSHNDRQDESEDFVVTIQLLFLQDAKWATVIIKPFDHNRSLFCNLNICGIQLEVVSHYQLNLHRGVVSVTQSCLLSLPDDHSNLAVQCAFSSAV